MLTLGRIAATTLIPIPRTVRTLTPVPTMPRGRTMHTRAPRIIPGSAISTATWSEVKRQRARSNGSTPALPPAAAQAHVPAMLSITCGPWSVAEPTRLPTCSGKQFLQGKPRTKQNIPVDNGPLCRRLERSTLKQLPDYAVCVEGLARASIGEAGVEAFTTRMDLSNSARLIASTSCVLIDSRYCTRAKIQQPPKSMKPVVQ